MNFIKKISSIFLLGAAFVPFFVRADDIEVVSGCAVPQANSEEIQVVESQDVWSKKLHQLTLASPARVVFYKNWPSAHAAQKDIATIFGVFATEIIAEKPELAFLVEKLDPVGQAFLNELAVGFGFEAVRLESQRIFEDEKLSGAVLGDLVSHQMLADVALAAKKSEILITELLVIFEQHAPQAVEMIRGLLMAFHHAAFALSYHESFELGMDKMENLVLETMPKLLGELGFSDKNIETIARKLDNSQELAEAHLGPETYSWNTKLRSKNTDGSWVELSPSVEKVAFYSGLSGGPLAVYDIASGVLYTKLPVTLNDAFNMKDGFKGSFVLDDLGINSLALTIASSVIVQPFLEDISKMKIDRHNSIIVPRSTEKFIVSWAKK